MYINLNRVMIIPEITNADIMERLGVIQGQIHAQEEKIEGIVNNISTYNSLTDKRCSEITRDNLDTHRDIWISINKLKQTSNYMIGGIIVISAIWSVPVIYLLNELAGM